MERAIRQSAELTDVRYTFRGFPHFLAVYGAVSGLIRTGADVVALVVGLARDAARSNVRYAEVTVTPTSHLHAGTEPDELAEALTRGRTLARELHGVDLNWIFDIAGAEGLERGWETVAFALRHRPAGLVALGLGGLEVDRAQFHRHFTIAREAGPRPGVRKGILLRTDRAKRTASCDARSRVSQPAVMMLTCARQTTR